mgnify:CR=1 FL=1
MNIFKYINSKDIREHLKKINYEFTSLEAAWLIYQCKEISLKEKHEAFNELITNMPDCEIKQRNNTVPQKSLHKFLKRYIAIENRYMNEFCYTPNSAYRLQYIMKDGSDEYDNELYSSFEAIKNTARTYKDLAWIHCEKIILDKQHSRMTADFTANFEMLDLDIDSHYLTYDDYTIYHGVFRGLFFEFPTPFKAGDIVCNKYEKDSWCDGPFVLTEIGLSRYESEKKKNEIKECGDNSDMCAEGYFQNEDGSIYYEVMYNYMDLEYYNKKPTGVKRILIALSNYEKKEIDLSLLLNAYRYILNDGLTETSKPQWITEKGLYLAGIVENEPTIKIWLDDVRPAPDGYKLCRSVSEAKWRIVASEAAETKIEVIDCDHDLGDYAVYGGDGIKLIDWLAERKTFYPIKLHTQNPVGRENMQRVIDRYWPKS